MATIIESYRDGAVCGICHEAFAPRGWLDTLGFAPREHQYTHEGGEGHDGFHSKCLKDWLARNSSCPYDRQPIDRNSMRPTVQRNNRIKKIKTVLVDAACATGIGFAAAAVGMVVGAEEILKRAAVVGVLTAVLVGAERRVGHVGAAIVTTIGGLTGLAAFAIKSLELGVAAGVAAGVGAAAHRVFDRLEFDRLRRYYIVSGVGLGSTALLATNNVPLFCITTGVTAGILSLMRR